MKTISSVQTRRDRCYLIGRRAQRLSPAQAADAWFRLARKLEAMGDLDVPKFNDLLVALHDAAILARNPNALRSKFRQKKKTHSPADV